MKKRRNHIVPRFYLERWAPKGYVGLWVKEEKKIKLIPPKKVLREKGKHETVDDLLQVVESHIAPIISKIVENEEIPRNYQERENILVWILIQIQRTHLWEKKTQSLYRGILDMIRSDSVIRRYIREDGIGIDEVMSFYKRKFPRDIFNFNRMRTELYIKYMKDCRMVLGRSKISMVTSDDPVLDMPDKRKNLLETWYPVSPHLAIILEKGSIDSVHDFPSVIDVSDRVVKDRSIGHYLNCNRFLVIDPNSIPEYFSKDGDFRFRMPKNRVMRTAIADWVRRSYAQY